MFGLQGSVFKVQRSKFDVRISDFGFHTVSVTVFFYSYVKDLVGSAQTVESLPDGATLNDLFKSMATRFPKLATLEKSLLLAVGVDYQPRSYVLKDGDEVSLFPPVQGG